MDSVGCGSGSCHFHGVPGEGRARAPLLSTAEPSPDLGFSGGPRPCFSLPVQTNLLKLRELEKLTLQIPLPHTCTPLLQIKSPNCGGSITGNGKGIGGEERGRGLARHALPKSASATLLQSHELPGQRYRHPVSQVREPRLGEFGEHVHSPTTDKQCFRSEPRPML